MEPVENGIYRFELYNSQSSKCKVTFFSVSPACVFLEGRKAFGKAREEEASTMLVLLLLLLDSTISRGCFYIELVIGEKYIFYVQKCRRWK